MSCNQLVLKSKQPAFHSSHCQEPGGEGGTPQQQGEALILKLTACGAEPTSPGPLLDLQVYSRHPANTCEWAVCHQNSSSAPLRSDCPQYQGRAVSSPSGELPARTWGLGGLEKRLPLPPASVAHCPAVLPDAVRRADTNA